MSIIESLENAIEMWSYIKAHNLKTEDEYFSETGKEKIIGNSYLCEYTQKRFLKNPCKYCPIKVWGKTAKTCIEDDSFYAPYFYGKKTAAEVSKKMIVALNAAIDEYNKINSK